MSKKRCLYCGKILKVSNPFCSAMCKVEYNAFEKYVAKNIKFFITGIVGFLILAFIGMIVSAYYTKIGIGIMIGSGIGVFITMIVFPFATPETIKLIGVKKSIIIVRAIVIIFLVAMIITIFI